MSCPLFPRAYEELIQEDIEWLEANSPSELERGHIVAVLRQSVSEAEAQAAKLRAGEPGPKETCSDCGRAMVWQYDGRKGGAPAWMCPNCVCRRMDAAERALRRVGRSATTGEGYV